MVDKAHLERVTKALADDGRLIEAGWASLRLQALPPDAPVAQVTAMRIAFMTGAQHLFASMIGMMDPGSEETPADIRRMDLIHKELEAFRNEMSVLARRAKGSG